ncbi:hypothetical protein BOX15_Mlig025434g1 [Macrostomum lignano]|uniref:C2H2-type domain-containing protein n=1 Tax=Macrostomum lignano TaxID=282301 RepID=A0A267GU67_9PLAT|nr:hypothetical protein BOX15_Mlig025434g1 [Macrostomum lignano]
MSATQPSGGGRHPPWVHVLSCPACSFATLVVDKLNRHISNCHGGQQLSYTLFVCPLCDACSTDCALIDEHLSIYHSGDCATTATSAAAVEAHSCSACRLVFKSLAALRGHACSRKQNLQQQPPNCIVDLEVRMDQLDKAAHAEFEDAADPLMSRLLNLWASTGADQQPCEQQEGPSGARLTATPAAGPEPAEEAQAGEAGPAALSSEDAAAGNATRRCPATLQCGTCPGRFTKLHSLFYHQLHFHSACRCPVCECVFFDTQAAEKHVAEEHPGCEIYRCPRCVRRFSMLEGLRQHWNDEHSRSAFKCPFCSRLFLQERFLTRHVRLMHPCQLARQPKRCPQCPQVLDTAEALRRHLTVAHNSDPMSGRLRCGVCGRYYKNERSLRQHQDSHRPLPQPFACSLCPYACNTRYLLRCHIRDKHTDFTYDCRLCGSRFMSRYLLRRHMDREHQLADAAAAVKAAASLRKKRS